MIVVFFVVVSYFYREVDENLLYFARRGSLKLLVSTRRYDQSVTRNDNLFKFTAPIDRCSLFGCEEIPKNTQAIVNSSNIPFLLC